MLLRASRLVTGRKVSKQATVARRYATGAKKSPFSRPGARNSTPKVPSQQHSAPLRIPSEPGLTISHVGVALTEDGYKEELAFHWVWLRDHCQCQKCRSSSGQKLYRIEDFEPPEGGAGFPSLKNGNLHIRWYDGHQSVFTREWLEENSYGGDSSQKRLDSHAPYTWDGQIIRSAGGIPDFSYEKVMSSESELHRWMAELDLTGLTILKGAPKERGIVTALCNRVAYPRNTMYGLSWDVESVPNPNNLAYTSLPLPLHADLCYFEAPPGIQLLHCIAFEQKKGGENIFVDGFHAAKKLYEIEPEYYALLAQVPTIFHKDDNQHQLKYGHPIIGIARHSGALSSINWSPPFEGTQFVPHKMVPHYYDARKLFSQILNDPALAFTHRSAPGDVVVFNNRRVLHSRTAFDEKQGHRLLEGAYIGSDEFADKLRVLNRQFAGGAPIKDGSGYTL